MVGILVRRASGGRHVPLWCLGCLDIRLDPTFTSSTTRLFYIGYFRKIMTLFLNTLSKKMITLQRPLQIIQYTTKAWTRFKMIIANSPLETDHEGNHNRLPTLRWPRSASRRLFPLPFLGRVVARLWTDQIGICSGWSFVLASFAVAAFGRRHFIFRILSDELIPELLDFRQSQRLELLRVRLANLRMSPEFLNYKICQRLSHNEVKKRLT